MSLSAQWTCMRCWLLARRGIRSVSPIFGVDFIPFKGKVSTDYWSHFDPDRMRAPQYQNALQIFFSFLYLALYTSAINTINSTGELDVVEGILYIMTAGFLFDEIAKLWKDKSQFPRRRQ